MLLSVSFINSNTGMQEGGKLVSQGKLSILWEQEVAGSNWILSQVPDSSRSLVKAQLLNATTGYIAGACNTFFSDKKNKLSPDGKYEPENIFPGIKKYYNQIGLTSDGSGYKGLFLKTTNGGVSWNTYGNLPLNVYYLLGMDFININTGYVSASLNYSGGIQSGILKTTNGGNSWSSLISVDSVDINNIFTFDGNSIFATGWKRHYGYTNKGF